jgi:branched-chain amino acid transport system substrate-binding protein
LALIDAAPRELTEDLRSTMRVTPSPARHVAALAAVALLIPACGSAEGDFDGPGTARNEATGEPIKIGYVNQEGAATGSFPGLRNGTEAAIEYVNRDLGGIDGRPIELVECTVNGSPESSQKCANEMVLAKVPAVLAGLDFSGPSGTAVLEAAGIPYVTSSPIAGTDFTGENVFALLGGGPGQLTGLASYVAGNLEAKSVTIFVHDTPSGESTTDIFRSALEDNGVTDINVVKEQPNAPDFTAGMTLANRDEPDAIALFFTGAACAQTMLAAKSLGVEADLFSTSTCSDPTVLAAAGDAANGVYFAQEILPFSTHAEDPQVSEFLDVMKRYKNVGTDELTGHHANGFSAAMTFYDILTQARALDAAGVTDALKTAQGTGYMDDDYSCDRSLLPAFPTVCNASIRVTTVEDGRPAEASTDWIQP